MSPSSNPAKIEGSVIKKNVGSSERGEGRRSRSQFKMQGPTSRFQFGVTLQGPSSRPASGPTKEPRFSRLSSKLRPEPRHCSRRRGSGCDPSCAGCLAGNRLYEHDVKISYVAVAQPRQIQRIGHRKITSNPLLNEKGEGPCSRCKVPLQGFNSGSRFKVPAQGLLQVLQRNPDPPD